MKKQDAFELILLAALWGGSFLFMRLGASEFGAFALAELRVLLATLALFPLLAWRGELPALRQHWRPIAVIGVINSALPFVAWAYAALTLNAGFSSVLNATAPLWGALVAWVWLHEKPGASRVLGLVIGFLGVAWLAFDRVGLKAGAAVDVQSQVVALAVAACLGATLMYGIGANATKKWLTGVPPMAVAAGSQLMAGLVLAPPAAYFWPIQTPSAQAWACILVLGLLCTGLAYLLFFRLIAHVGPAKAISVTFLIPVFGVLWGGLFLGEVVSAVMLMAGGVVLLGTALATGVIRLRAAS